MRRYHGRLGAKKAYVGKKSVNLKFGKEQALHLAAFLLTAIKRSESVDMTVFLGQVKKGEGPGIPRGETLVTVTTAG